MRRRESCSMGPRPGVASSSPPAEPRERVVPAASALDVAIGDFLDYLRVERGVSPATTSAYAVDLRDFARTASREEAWRDSPEVAVRYLAARSRRGAAGDRGLAPTSLRRRAAAIRGFYRFAYGEGVIPTDVAARLDLPRQPRLLPETLDVAEVERLLEAAGGSLRDRALLELLYAAGLRVGEAVGLDLEDLSRDSATVRVTGKGDRERVVPVGEIAMEWLGRWLATAGPCSSAIAGGGSRASRRGRRSRARRPAPASAIASAHIRCGTRSRRISSRAAPTCASSRSCLVMRVSARPSSTRT